ncbi:MAG: response regulator [Bacteroidetes bacterium]|nr:response regulator [Bacteroidota bacterium]
MSLQGKSVFIVEDEPTWAATLTARLGKKFTVQHFTSGEECLAKLASVKPAIVVLDYHLEGTLTGLDTLKRIRKESPATKVVMFSAQDDVQTAVDILDNGAYEYIVKGDNAMNRLSIVLRNLEEAEELREQMITLRVRFRKEKFWLWIVIFGILLGCIAIYLNTCPQRRMVQWDPFGLEQTNECVYLDDKSK